MNNSSLSNLLTELYRRLNKIEEVDADVAEKIDLLIESNGLRKDENVPTWVKNFFHLILEGKSTVKLYIDPKEARSSEADVLNFLAELEDLINIDCDDSGEEIEMVFRNLGIYALISIESGFYQIQSASDPTCASYAAEKFAKFLGRST